PIEPILRKDFEYVLESLHTREELRRDADLGLKPALELTPAGIEIASQSRDLDRAAAVDDLPARLTDKSIGLAIRCIPRKDTVQIVHATDVRKLAPESRRKVADTRESSGELRHRMPEDSRRALRMESDADDLRVPARA